MATFKTLLETGRPLILHGALGTELENRGYDISGSLWSAKYLIEDPQAIKDIHKDYIRAGADIVTTSSYQATVPGLAQAGIDREEAEQLIRLTVALAKEARDEVWAELSEEDRSNRTWPLISGDIGPYAAFLADGSEYTGDYKEISLEELKDFHRPRIALLLEEEVDLLALETIPSALEVQALLELLAEEFPTVEAYMSFTTQDGQTLSDGTPVAQVTKPVASSQQVLALGVNCSQPDKVSPFLVAIAEQTDKPLVTYPNSGEIYDGATQTWHSSPDTSHSLTENTQTWIRQGAQVVGGCCRTRPADIAALSQQIKR
ncbi:homocysteine S-methyltransferase [Streptococcus caprae]|uniref:Homocysteine S-methyltransferase n=1 Tax=Streptococcus caprae TaxID=1640501 RepID=A0ABV8CUI6_9STRE